MNRATLVLGGLALSLALGAAVVRSLGVMSDPATRAVPSSTAEERGKALKPTRDSAGRVQLPNLSFIDGSEQPRSLADFRGRFILLNVWATWCTPCRKEMPSLDRLQQALGGPEFEVLALSIDRGGVPAVEPFYEEMDLRFLRIFVDTSTEALGALRAVGIPVTLLVDPHGREIWRVTGALDWDTPAVIERIRREMARERGKASRAPSGARHGALS